MSHPNPNPNIARMMREVPPEWDRLMRAAHRLDFGELRIIIKSGKPVRVEAGIKQINLDSENDFQKDLTTIPLL